MRERHHELVYIGGAHDILVSDFIEVSISDVLPHGTVEQVRSLVHDRDVVAEMVDVYLPELVQPNRDRALGGLVQPLQ